MSALTSRPGPRSRSLRRLISPHPLPLIENMDMDDNNDWKLSPNVELKVVLNKLSDNDLEQWRSLPRNSSARRTRNEGQNTMRMTLKSKAISKAQKTLVHKQTSSSSSKNIADELRDLLPRCDTNCKHCEEYILQLTQHIQSTHEWYDDDEQFFHSLISNVPEEKENDQGSPESSPLGIGIDLDPSLDMTQTQTQDSDSQSQSRTLVIRNTKVIYYVEELNENELGQIQTPLTSEGQHSTSTSFQNCLKNDNNSTEIEFVHFPEDDNENEHEHVEDLEVKMDVDVNVDPMTSIGDQNSASDSEPEDADKDNANDSDPDFVDEEENDQDSNSEMDEDDDEIKKERSNEEIKTNIFVCGICQKTFVQKVDVQRHMARAHTIDTFLTCPMCSGNYASQKLLGEHMLKIHGEVKHTTAKLFKCENCGKIFNSKRNLQYHERTHREKTFKCKFPNCGKSYKQNTELKNHMHKIHTDVEKTHNNPKQNYKCETCGKTYDVLFNFTVHQRTHTGERPFNCTVCNAAFTSASILSSHMLIHQEKSEACEYCGKRFHRRTDVRTHIRRIHADEAEAAGAGIPSKPKVYKCDTCEKSYEAPSLLNVHKRTHTGEKPFKCDVCNASFTTAGILSGHMEIHGEKSEICEHCGNGFHRKTDLRKHIRRIHTDEFEFTAKPKMHKCDTCEKSYEAPSLLQVHMRTHTGEKPFKCNVCNATFTSSGLLSGHVAIHGEKSQICEHCGKGFHRKADLVKHIRRVHTRDFPMRPKMHKCDTCEKSFVSPAILEEHKRTHTGEKPFMCEFCSKCFIGSSALLHHMKTHQEKSLQCDHCGKAFHFKRDLKEHSIIHTREKTYKCEYEECEESFLIAQQLELHQRIHTGEKVYKCQVGGCGKYFPVMKRMTAHQRFHREERRFSCSKCYKSFKTNGHLRTHFKIHTGIKAFKCDECGKCFTLPSELRSHQKRKSKCSPPEPEPVEVLGI